MDKKIKILKTLLLVFGSVLIFSNSMGLLVNTMMFTDVEYSKTSGVDLLFANFGLICVSAITLGVLLLIGGIILNPKFKWTRMGVMIIAWIALVGMLIFTISFTVATHQEEVGIIFSLGALVMGLLFSSPFGVLIVYLNKSVIARHFT